MIEKRAGNGNCNEEKNLIVEAIDRVKGSEQDRINESNERELQVFLLEKGVPTDSYKSTSGGMLQSKKCFWDIGRDCGGQKN